MKLGISTWGIEGKLIDAARIAAKYFNVVEVFIRSYEELKTINVQGLKKLNVVFTVHAPEQASLTLPNLQELKKSIEIVKSSIDLAYSLDSDIVVVHSGRKYDEQSTDRLVYALRECSSYAEALGVYLCLENGWGRGLIHTLSQIREVISKVGSDYLKATLDIGHYFIVGMDPVEEYQKNYDIVFQIHLHSNYGNKDEHLPPYVGLLDLRRFVKVLKERMYNRCIVLEVKCGKKPEDFISDMKKELERYFI